MPNIGDITKMCRDGKVSEAYDIAKQELGLLPHDVWKQRAMGWALYYAIKEDVSEHKVDAFMLHLEELMALDMLTVANDSMIFDNLLWIIGQLVRILKAEEMHFLDRIFQSVRRYSFNASNGYSFFLKAVIAHKEWTQLVDFIDWWNLDKLLPEDYDKVRLANGNSILSLAELVYICYAKKILVANDKGRIDAFLPKIKHIADNYPQMMYPGYFCGKLMMASANPDEALKAVLPFARKKKSEFWLWNLMADIHREDVDVRQACLLRAVHCRTEEKFLGRTRQMIIRIYLNRHDYNRARFHIDCITRCCLSEGIRIPYDVQDWVRESWFSSSSADSTDSLDFMSVTDRILCQGANVSVCVVAYIDNEKKRAGIIYGYKQRALVKLTALGQRVKEGTLLWISWMPESNGKINILRCEIADAADLNGLDYLRQVEGTIKKKDNQGFAFLQKGNTGYFVRPDLVAKYGLVNADNASALAIYNYNNKKNEWTWTCLSLKRINK